MYLFIYFNNGTNPKKKTLLTRTMTKLKLTKHTGCENEANQKLTVNLG